MEKLFKGIRSLFAQLLSGTYLPDSALPDLRYEPSDILRIRSDMLDVHIDRCLRGVNAFRDYTDQHDFRRNLELSTKTPDNGERRSDSHDENRSLDKPEELKLPGEIDLLAGLLLAKDGRIAVAAAAALNQSRVFAHFAEYDRDWVSGWIKALLGATKLSHPDAYELLIQALFRDITDDNRSWYSTILDELIQDRLLDSTDPEVEAVRYYAENGVLLDRDQELEADMIPIEDAVA